MIASHIKLKNWRNFRSVEADLQEVSYVMGPNASGKSNFLDVFRFLRDVASSQGGGLSHALEMRGGFSKVRCLAARQNPNVEIEITFAESMANPTPIWRYTLKIGQQSRGHFLPKVIREEVFSFAENRLLLQRPDAKDDADPRLLTQTALEQLSMNGPFREVVDFLSRVLYLHLVPQLLKFGNELAVKKMTNDPFGQGFLEKIANTPEKTRKARLARIAQILKEVIHGFSDLHYEMDKTGQPHLQMRYVHWRAKGGFQTEEEFSDGTLRLIALIWTLLESGSMILLEEPELSLHNAIVEKIPEMIQRTRESRKKGANGQIIISTHSEALLGSPVICGQYLTIMPQATEGEGSRILGPTEQDRTALLAGLSPAEVLLPKTAVPLENLGKFV